MSVWDYFRAAGEVASGKDDERTYHLGALGIRSDGVRVQARNGAALYLAPQAHAEARLCRKLTPKSVVYVVRLSRSGEGYRMAKPCANCRKALKQRGVLKVYYTISPSEYGVIDFRRESE